MKITAMLGAMALGIKILAQAAPADPTTQFVIQVITQLGTSGVIVVILLKIRKDDETRHQSNREAERVEREKDREERRSLTDRIFDMAEKSTSVAQTGTEITEHRRKRTQDVNETVLERLDEVLGELTSGRDRRKS